MRAPRSSSRIQVGDVVCGPSTDYRDVRKAAYQEYLVTSDFNVARIPAATTVKNGAAIGVAFVAAVIALGVSLGLDLSRLKDAPGGPDLYDLVRRINRRDVPEDVRAEVYDGIPESERLRPGDWLTIWGGSSATAIFILQLAKRAGLRVIAVADVAKHGSRLYDLGADVLVDRLDEARAVEIIRSVTGGRLRFAIDASSKESATLLQDALLQSDHGQQSHLLGLTGLPKQKPHSVVHHTIPIKIFHDLPVVGETVMEWLEELLLSKSLEGPEIEVADGGLAGVNAALDRLRHGKVGAKRIVVPVGDSYEPKSSQLNAVPNMNDINEDDEHLAYHDSINTEPDRLKFAYWVPK